MFVFAQDDATLFAGAADRIEQHRKDDVRIKVLNADGNPVSDVEVHLEQNSHEFLFGANVFNWNRCRTEEENESYKDRFAALLNYATLGFYWASYEKERGKPNHDYTKQVAGWCKEHGIATKGHPLAWNHTDAPWHEGIDTDELFRLQIERIEDCVQTMSGWVDRWDVVNEITYFDTYHRTQLHTEMWRKVGKIEFTKECLIAARKATPNAILLVNDHATDEEYVKVLEQLVDADGKKLYDEIGIQSHMSHMEGVWSNTEIWEICERFARFGVPLHFTEMTIISSPNTWEDTIGKGNEWLTTPDGEEKQKDDVLQVFTMLFSHPSVEAITWWDLSDQGSYLNAPSGFLRKDMSPKPVYNALMEQIKTHWTTNVRLKTGENGIASTRAFRGAYTVRVGDTTTLYTVKKGAAGEIVITLN